MCYIIRVGILYYQLDNVFVFSTRIKYMYITEIKNVSVTKKRTETSEYQLWGSYRRLHHGKYPCLFRMYFCKDWQGRISKGEGWVSRFQSSTIQPNKFYKKIQWMCLVSSHQIRWFFSFTIKVNVCFLAFFIQKSNTKKKLIKKYQTIFRAVHSLHYSSVQILLWFFVCVSFYEQYLTSNPTSTAKKRIE